MNEQIREDIDTILTNLPTLAMSYTTEDQGQNLDPQAPVYFIDIHVYDLAPDEEEPSIIESTIQSQEATHSGEQPSGRNATAASRRATCWFLFAATMIVCSLVGTDAATILFLVPTWTPSATVTIVPVSKQITTTSTVTVVPGTADATHHQLAGRVFSSVTMSQTRTIATTGTNYQDAKAAQGHITFYNTAPTAQTIAAGTLLTGTDGIQAVTDQDTIIPAVNYPILGQATVTAHAVIAGPGGDIKADDIYGFCCRVDVSAVNSAFTGGQDAHTYQTVTQQDMKTTTTTLKASIYQSVQAAFQAQVHQDETLITPFPCQQSINADHQVGEEATQVHITESETCTGEAYSTNTYHDLMMQLVSQEATKQLGADYTSAGDLQTHITQTTLRDQSVVTLQITGACTWAYKFDPPRGMMTMIAGKNKTQALVLLLHIPGVQSASIKVTTGATIPTDSAHIRIVYL